MPDEKKKRLPTDVVWLPRLTATRAQVRALRRFTDTGMYGDDVDETAEILLGAAIRDELRKGF